MKLVIQRVNHASVTVEGKVTGEIKKGYLVLLGVGQGDDESMVERYVKKLHKLRIFSDEEGKINRSIEDVGGEVLVVSQFTLYADCKKVIAQALRRQVPQQRQSAYTNIF